MLPDSDTFSEEMAVARARYKQDWLARFSNWRMASSEETLHPQYLPPLGPENSFQRGVHVTGGWQNILDRH